MTIDNKEQSTWFLHPATGLIFTIHEKCLHCRFCPLHSSWGSLSSLQRRCVLQTSDLRAGTDRCIVQYVRLPIMSLIILPDFTCALSGWNTKINEAFVLNQEAIYEYSSTYSKLCRLLYHKTGWGCLLSKREREEQRKMICYFLACKQFSNRKVPTS